jgi:5-(carboxyamino)imidazole ribonucleotide mutase
MAKKAAKSTAPADKEKNPTRPLVGIVMGSESDWQTMRHAPDTLDQFGVASECRVLSAHRTPDEAVAWVEAAAGRGIEVIIAAAGGAAHLAGVTAAHTRLPVLGVPLEGWALNGLDALLSTVMMPRGIPVGTLAIGKAGAVNAAMLALRILALSRPSLDAALAAAADSEKQRILAVELKR